MSTTLDNKNDNDSNLIPIPTLDPHHPPPSNASIRAIITLLWPYSSTTRQCALLLSDPDFRLRNRGGQVRVRFSGASARAIAKARVGIGDEVVLGLEGGRWEEDETRERTPGRGVEGGLWFAGKLDLRVLREERRVERVEVDELDVQVEETEVGGGERVVSTPINRNVARLREDGGESALPLYTYSSPAFAKRVRLSGEQSADYDPFGIDGIEEGDEKRGERTPFGLKINWRYAPKTPSPTKDTFDHLEGSPIRRQARDTSLAQDDSPVMLPPPMPRLDIEALVEQSVDDAERVEDPITPKLHPVTSATLPLPSPFPMDSNQPPFSMPKVPAQIEPSSPIDEVLEAPAALQDATVEADMYIGDDPKPPEVVEILSEDAETLEAEAGPPLTAPATIPEYINDDFERLISYDETTEPTTIEDVMMNDMTDPTAPAPTLPDEIPAVPATGPKTPVKAVFEQPVSLVGMDGTRSAPDSTKVTPQSEKDRVMKKTFSSLFGFKASPEPPELPRAQPVAEDAQDAPLVEDAAVEMQQSPTPVAPLSELAQERLAASAVHVAGDGVDVAVQILPDFKQDVEYDEEEGVEHEVVEDLSRAAERNPVVDAEVTQPTTARSTAVEVMELDSDSDSDVAPAEPDDERLEDPGLVEDDLNADPPATELQGQPTARDEESHRILSSPKDTKNDHRGGEEEQLASLSQDVAARMAAHEPDLLFQDATATTIPKLDISPVDTASSQPPYPNLPIDPTENVETDLAQPQSISYPSLPMTPSHSQPLNDMLSQELPGELSRDTLASVLPPTPQLTQAGSSMKAVDVVEQEDMIESQTVGDAEVPASLPHASFTPEMQDVDDVKHSRSQDAMADDVMLKTRPQREDQEQRNEIAQNQPQKDDLQREAFRPDGIDVRTDLQVHKNEVALAEHVPADTAPEQQEAGTDHPRVLRQTPARKSISSRLSNVPEVISAWFSPKRASKVAKNGEEQSALIATQVQDELKSPQAHKAESSWRRIHTNGVSTALGYFTPLSRLDENLNPASQQSYGTQAVDVLAVVTDATKQPVRAKGGPRDYYTIFCIADSSIPTGSSVRVEVFRPWKATLPVADAGDVILLRAFVAKSRKRLPYLLSTDASAWCVWRHRDAVAGEDNAKKPAWARKAGVHPDSVVREEVKGPPVEFGEEERDHAKLLREWWQTLSSEAADAQDDNAMDNDNELAVNGHGSLPVVAKF